MSEPNDVTADWKKSERSLLSARINLLHSPPVADRATYQTWWQTKTNPSVSPRNEIQDLLMWNQAPCWQLNRTVKSNNCAEIVLETLLQYNISVVYFLLHPSCANIKGCLKIYGCLVLRRRKTEQMGLSSDRTPNHFRQRVMEQK